MSRDNFSQVSKNLQGATYDNPYQAPYALNDYSQNVPPPTEPGGGPAYVNPYSDVDRQFFDPITPNDATFSDMQAPSEQSVADPVSQIMADFQVAQQKLFNKGGR